MGNHKDTQLNVLILEGRITRDAELKYSRESKPIVRFAMACNKGFGDNKRTFFIDVTYFGVVAEKICNDLVKGLPVVAQGRLEENVWEGKDGDTRKQFVMVADRVTSCEWPDTSSAPPRSPQAPASTENDDIPF